MSGLSAPAIRRLGLTEDVSSWAVVNSETGELVGLKDSRQTAISAAQAVYHRTSDPVVAVKLRFRPIEVIPTSPGDVSVSLVPNDCDMCGEPLDPSQPFDGHRECREQE